MDLDDALSIGNLGAAVTPRVVALPYRPPALEAMGWRFTAQYTAPAGDSADMAFGKGSILVYQWAWYDDLGFALRTGYSAPAGDAANVAMETR